MWRGLWFWRFFPDVAVAELLLGEGRLFKDAIRPHIEQYRKSPELLFRKSYEIQKKVSSNALSIDSIAIRVANVTFFA